MTALKAAKLAHALLGLTAALVAVRDKRELERASTDTPEGTQVLTTSSYTVELISPEQRTIKAVQAVVSLAVLALLVVEKRRAA